MGERLASWALARNYGKEKLPFSGPIYSLMRQEGDTMRIYFDHTFGGLKAKDDTLAMFEIAGEDGLFFEAEAKIEGDTVIVYSSKVQHPRMVRYAWRNDAEAYLFNEAGLPASPFHTAK